MALTNSERVKRWRGRNRVLWNLRRREYRKKDLSGGVESRHADVIPTELRVDRREQNVGRGDRAGSVGVGTSGSSAPPAQPSPFRLIKSEPIVEEVPAPPPKVYKNDFGVVITKGQWDKLQEMKRKAKEGGYEFDGSQL